MRGETNDGPAPDGSATRVADDLDLAAIFAALPGVDLVLAPDAPRYTMLAATDGRLAATMTTREGTLGRPLFDVFPDANPANAAASGVGNLEASLDTVLRTRAPHRMGVQRYDLQRPDGTWEERHWAPLNVPVLGPDGAVRYLIHRVEDVTDAVRLAAEGDRLRGAVAGSEQARASAEAARDALAVVHTQLQEQALELALANQHLQEQASDLAAQAEVRRGTMAALAERTAAAERALADLAASEARFRIVQDASPLGFAIHRPVREGGRPDGRVVDFTLPYVNAAGAAIVGRSREHLLAGTVLGIWPGTGPEGVFADYVRVLATGESFTREILYEHDELVAGLTLTVVRIGEGTEAEIGVTFTDITARLRAERERERLLADSKAALAAADLERRRLATVLDQLPVGVTLAEAPSGRLILSNAVVRRIWGLDTASARVDDYSPDYVGYHTGPVQAVGRPYASHEWPLARALTQGETVVDEVVEIQRPDGTRRRVSISAAPVRDADARVVGGVVISLDVTERERLVGEREQALVAERAARAEAEAARGAAEAANRTKGEFLAVMSHELRTPLNAIGGYAELLEMGIRGAVTEQQREDLGRIQRSQRHLLGLVNEVLNYAKLETGSVRYEVATVVVAQALTEAEGLVAPQARAKGIALAAADCATAMAVRADAEKLRQVLVNLLSNAVKFTNPGGRIAVACAAGAADGTAPDGDAPDGPVARVRIAVRDTGIGIPVDKLAAIFEPFVQVRSTLTRTAEGTGLGLAISRDLARGMGGDLTVESTVGVGSTFTLTLPSA